MNDIDRKTAEDTLIDDMHGLPPLPAPVNVLELMDGMEFPAEKVAIVEYAADMGASEDILDQLQAMPDVEVTSLAHLSRLFGTIEHQPGEENLFSSEESHDLPDANDRALTELYGSGRV